MLGPVMKKSFHLVSVFLASAALLPADWLTFDHDPQRTGWAWQESTLTPESATNLELKWSTQLDNAPLALDALTAPLLARDVLTPSGLKSLVYVAGSSNRLFAIDVASGAIVWQRTLENFVKAKEDPFYLCPNAVNATPVIDRRQNMIFVLAYDGRLFGLDLGSGVVKFGPFQLVPPFAKAWSLNLSQGFVYTTTSQGCGGDRSGIYAIQVDQAGHHETYETVVRQGFGAGMWSRGGTAIGTNGRLYVTTGDGAFNPAAGDYGSTFLAASMPELNIVDAFSPSNWSELNKRDLDLPSGGELFFSYRDRNLIVGGGKEAVVYLLDADSLGSKDHRTPLYVSPRLGNEKRVLEEKGFWGSPALWRDEHDQPWIYLPLWGEPSSEAMKLASSNGAALHGSILGFKVETDAVAKNPQLKLMWISPDINLPDAPAVANGVVFVLATGENPQQDKVIGKTNFKSKQDWKQNLLTTEERGQGTHPAVLKALDAKTGKLLYSGQNAMKTWNHFGGLAIDDGRVYAVDHSSTLYCFGLKNK